MAGYLRDELKSAIMIVAHTKKESSGGRGATRGSGVFENDADTIIVVEKTGDMMAEVEVVKQKDGPEGFNKQLKM